MAENKSRRELVLRAYAKLTSSAQPPNDDDHDLIDSYLDDLLEMLDYRGILNVPDTDDIEPRFVIPLSVLLADVCKDEYGGGTFDVLKAETDLRRINAASPTYETLKVEYF